MNKLTRRLLAFTACIGFVASTTTLPVPAWAQATQPARPTIVLVHGAFADSSSWNAVISKLQAKRFQVVAASNPLRGVKSDAAYVADLVRGVRGPVVLVGHSYGGAVISAAANQHHNVKGLVFVAAFAPESGETAVELSARFPGSTLGPTLAPPVILADGNKDLYIQQEKFHQQFAADVSGASARLMAATQRPVTEAALGEPAASPAWRNLPSWFVYGDADKNIPAAALAFMAKRAGSVKTVVIKGGSHVVMVSHPEAVAKLIADAASAEVALIRSR
jgi:pimeloyl-ACP methyl ester carboxylesterase